MSINRTFPIAGVKFRPGAHEYILGLEEGTMFNLETEPTNQFDPNAVKIIHEDEFGEEAFIGYVPKNFSAEISAVLEIEPLLCILKTKGEKSYQHEVVVKSLEDSDLPSDEEIDSFEDDNYEEPDLEAELENDEDED